MTTDISGGSGSGSGSGSGGGSGGGGGGGGGGMWTIPTHTKLRIVIDSDASNQVDDRFALSYALLSPERLQVEAVYAAPHIKTASANPSIGMETSYAEIAKLLRLHDAGGVRLFRGSAQFMRGPREPVHSDAAFDIVKRALASPIDNPLYVVGIGAMTNLASALLLNPDIIAHVIVVWLGGNALHWPDTAEFNLSQDVHAARIVLDSGVRLVLVPCMGVASHLSTTVAELDGAIKGTGVIGEYLGQVFRRYAKATIGSSRVIWDLAAVGVLLDETWIPTVWTPSPLLEDGLKWQFDKERHLIRCATFVDRDRIFGDFFKKVRSADKV